MRYLIYHILITRLFYADSNYYFFFYCSECNNSDIIYLEISNLKKYRKFWFKWSVFIQSTSNFEKFHYYLIEVWCLKWTLTGGLRNIPHNLQVLTRLRDRALAWNSFFFVCSFRYSNQSNINIWLSNVKVEWMTFKMLFLLYFSAPPIQS